MTLMDEPSDAAEDVPSSSGPNPAVSAGRVAIAGNGVVGGRLHRRLGLVIGDEPVVSFDTRRHDPATTRLLDEVSIVVLATPGPHVADAAALLGRGIAVVSVGDQVDDVRAMLSLDHLARRHDVPLVVGAGMSPGLVGLLARHLATEFHQVDEIHVGIHGTAGPACARQHHRALSRSSVSIIGGAERVTNAGTGRELVWFPEPVGAYDCYRAEVPGPLLLRRVFPTADRVTARMSANRRDRFTSRLPMLRPPHGEGGVGALRVELRGSDAAGGRHAAIAGIAELVGTAAAATAGAFVEAVRNGTLPTGAVVSGSSELDTVALLRSVERLGVRLQSFTGVPNRSEPPGV